MKYTEVLHFNDICRSSVFNYNKIGVTEILRFNETITEVLSSFLTIEELSKFSSFTRHLPKKHYHWNIFTQETLSLKYFSTNNKIATYNNIIASKSSYPPVMAVLPLQY